MPVVLIHSWKLNDCIPLLTYKKMVQEFHNDHGERYSFLGLCLYQYWPIVTLQGAGHNDVELYNQYLERLKTFVSTELTNWRGPKDPKSPELLNAKKLEEEEKEKGGRGGEAPLTLMWEQTERFYQSVGPFIPQHWQNKKYLNSLKAHIEIKCQVYQKARARFLVLSLSTQRAFSTDHNC